MSKLDSIHANQDEPALDSADVSGPLQLQLLYPGQRTRVYRVQLPGRTGSVIAKEPRGADARASVAGGTGRAAGARAGASSRRSDRTQAS